MNNTQICQKLRRLHTLCVLGKRSNNLALALRRALDIIPTWQEDIEKLIQKKNIRILFAGYGPKFIKIMEELLQTGSIQMLDELQPQFDPFFCYLCEIPSIGETMARRMFFDRSICTMDDLRIAYSNEILKKIPAFGETRLKAIEAILFDGKEKSQPVPKETTPLSDIGDPDENLSNEIELEIPTPKPVCESRSMSFTSTGLYSTRMPVIVDKSRSMSRDIHRPPQTVTIRGPIHDFGTLREWNGFYIDKTMLLADLIESGASVVQYQRPAGFGMSLALSMMERFFAREFEPGKPTIDPVKWFHDLRIMQTGPRFLEEMGRYPVIHLAIADSAKDTMARAVTEMFQKFRWILDDPELEEHEARQFRTYPDPSANFHPGIAIRSLSRWIYRVTGIPVLCLVDLPFMGLASDDSFCDILQPIWADNPAISRCILATHEILPLNGCQIVSVHHKSREEFFGFTEFEVRSLLGRIHAESYYAQIQEWCGNFDIGGRDVFMPGEVMAFIQSLQAAQPMAPNERIWAMFQTPTARPDLNPSIYQDMLALCLNPRPDYTIVREIHGIQNDTLGYGKLLDAGLVRAVEQIPTRYGSIRCRLNIPNRYTRQLWSLWLRTYRIDKIQNDTQRCEILKSALVHGPEGVLDFELRRMMAVLPFVYEPDAGYYRQILAELGWSLGFQFVGYHDDTSLPNLLFIEENCAIGLYVDVLSRETLESHQLSAFLSPDPDLSEAELQKLMELLVETASGLGRGRACVDVGARIRLRYPEVSETRFYSVAFCRNQCRVLEIGNQGA